ncbi:hypothetical protein O6H91_06G093500 [Diphasiastrum complanatum]|uniref:Uncharacterized protein n=1 Tax=Diphasiastrum complanatum TaxID=34168 RepID=A0ACC2DGN5_DIPCM|nr:hypothetical protein O6H91_06G093500 [Diphasiastrum complanatum]
MTSSHSCLFKREIEDIHQIRMQIPRLQSSRKQRIDPTNKKCSSSDKMNLEGQQDKEELQTAILTIFNGAKTHSSSTKASQKSQQYTKKLSRVQRENSGSRQCH